MGKRLEQEEIESKVEKLPKWAQDHIRYINMQREAAVRSLNEYIDDQTESAFSVTDNVCSGEEKGPSRKKRYVQTYQIDVQHNGVNLNVINRDDGIYLSWGSHEYRSGEVACIPYCHQSIRLVSKENMRT